MISAPSRMATLTMATAPLRSRTAAAAAPRPANTVSSNNAFGADGGGEGGGIFNDGGTVRLNDSTVTGNTADGDGGGIYNQTGTVTLKDSTISGNNPDNCAPSSSIPGCTG